MAKRAIAVLGDINIDLVAAVPDFRGLGYDYLAPALELHLGGVAANTAMALARWGVAARLLGAVGRDWFGEVAQGQLRRNGVDVSCVQRVRGALTGLLLVPVTRGGQRTFFGSRGANQFVQARGARRWLRGATALHLMGYNFLNPSTAKTARMLLDEARRRRMQVTLDAGMAPARDAARSVLHAACRTDILFLSRDEGHLLTGERAPQRAAQALHRLGVRAVVVKLGERGCRVSERGAAFQAPPFPARVVDTTGCGDAFTAAFLFALGEGCPMREAALLANAAGAAAAGVTGAGENLPGPRATLRALSRQGLRSPWEEARRALLTKLRKKFAGKNHRPRRKR